MPARTSIVRCRVKAKAESKTKAASNARQSRLSGETHKMLDTQKSNPPKETTWIIDHATGALTVEGLTERELQSVASDLLPEAAHVNCARPINAPPMRGGSNSTAVAEENSLYVFRVYHGSVVEGPGRRSVAQLSGCPILCRDAAYLRLTG